MKDKLLPLAASLTIALVALLWTACNKPTPFGAELLDDQVANYAFTDTLSVRYTIQREDSVITSSTASHYLCGELNDPVFGKSRAELFTLLRLANLDPGFDSTTMTVDSIVLFMRYSSLGVYGDTLQRQTLRVLRLTSPIQYTKNYYSDDSLPAGAEIGRVDDFLPRPRTADNLFVATSTAPYLRVKLDNSFGRELLHMDSTKTASDTAFWRLLRGLKIVTSAAGATPGAMLAFNLEDVNYSRVRLYYTKAQDTIPKTYDYFFVGVKKFARYTHDYAGTPAGQKIGQVSDDLLYVQGMQGLRLQLEFPTANALNDLIVNKAELELTAATLPGDVLFPAEQLVLTQVQGDSTSVFTSDVLYSLGPSFSEGFTRFGGYPESVLVNGLRVTRYRLSLSDVFQQIVDDDSSSDLKKRTLYLSVYPQNRSGQRAILYGPKSAVFPAKLNLKYTRLQ